MIDECRRCGTGNEDQHDPSPRPIETHPRAIRALQTQWLETAEQRDVLMQCGCHVMQGFFYSAPVNAIAVSGIVARFRALPDHLRLARTSRLSTLDITDSPPGLRPAH